MPVPSVPARAASILVLGLAALAPLRAADPPPGEAKARASDCFSCHAIDRKLVGPAYVEVAKRYAGQGDAAVRKLVTKIRSGGAGDWGDVPMTPHPQLDDADLAAMVHWILSLKPGTASAEAVPKAQSHTYRTADGKSVTTDFAVFDSPAQKHVTQAVFHGYEQYNSYCFRCHGGDAVGGEYAPDLRTSLGNGMSYRQFLSTAMAGRPDKGMPSWAGFFEDKDIRAIYDYVKARQLDLVAPGRPPSDQD